ncbi:ABC-three component system middle component 5 [Pseudomonas sp. ENNP23]|uniref:ABC-three component system middle component 5 n=1 Tax=Pseudomonas sp. ENNP23 TaxID=1535636 RepID=UPI001C43C41A|nr:ABC-three component system middle component 5 [Pseudomonas sp. ENNP23]
MLALIDSLPEVELDMLRLCDFYLVFPSEISNIRLPNDISHGRKIGKAASNIYRNPINAKHVFRDMSEIQLSALRNIAASGLIDIELYERGIARKRSKVQIPELISQQIKSYLETQSETIEFVIKSLSKVPLRGINGLKHRTELLEHRYDTP